MTGILNRLEKRGLVERARSGNDRRAVVIKLTATGEQLLDQAPPLLQDRFRRELLTLQQWEQTQMLSTLQRIASMMDAEDIDASPVLAVGDVTPSTKESVAEPTSEADKTRLEADTSRISKKTK